MRLWSRHSNFESFKIRPNDNQTMYSVMHAFLSVLNLRCVKSQWVDLVHCFKVHFFGLKWNRLFLIVTCNSRQQEKRSRSHRHVYNKPLQYWCAQRRLCACALARQRHQGKRRMAEDVKDDLVATDDDSDRTGADGSNILNYAVKLWLLPVLMIPFRLSQAEPPVNVFNVKLKQYLVAKPFSAQGRASLHHAMLLDNQTKTLLNCCLFSMQIWALVCFIKLFHSSYGQILAC